MEVEMEVEMADGFEDEAGIAEREAHLRDRFPVLEFFEAAHLSGRPRMVSLEFRHLAYNLVEEDDLVGETKRPAEVAAGLRKLLEAKDCFVRAALP